MPGGGGRAPGVGFKPAKRVSAAQGGQAGGQAGGLVQSLSHG